MKTLILKIQRFITLEICILGKTVMDAFFSLNKLKLEEKIVLEPTDKLLEPDKLLEHSHTKIDFILFSSPPGILIIRDAIIVGHHRKHMNLE